MGLYYQLENNELGLCLECAFVIEGGEAGCIAYTQAGLETLRMRGVNEDVLNLFFLAYKLQHHTYFNISEKEAIVTLRTVGSYLSQKQYHAAPKATSINTPKTVTLTKALSSVFMVQILAATTKKESNALITQYITDIWNAYAAYHANLFMHVDS